VNVQSSFISTIRKMMFQAPRAVAVTEGSEGWTCGLLRRKSELGAQALDSQNIPVVLHAAGRLGCTYGIS
jgi:hypothetical protein